MSHNPDTLPFVSPGIIWDGVTEYQDHGPPGHQGVYLLHMYGDGTRRFSDWVGHGSPMTGFRYYSEAWETTNIGVAIERPYIRVDGENTYYSDGKGFLNYDGTMSFEPVNQFFYSNPFTSHAARFAHQLDITMGGHTLLGADERDRLIVHQSLSAIIGAAARRYAEWDAIDPEDLIIGGNFDGTPLWKNHERTVQDYIDTDIALCGQCDIDIFAREFYFEADLAEFRREWRQGIIYSANRTTTPWSTALFDVAPGSVSDFHDELDNYFHKMLRHYAQVVAVQDRHTA